MFQRVSFGLINADTRHTPPLQTRLGDLLVPLWLQPNNSILGETVAVSRRGQDMGGE